MTANINNQVENIPLVDCSSKWDPHETVSRVNWEAAADTGQSLRLPGHLKTPSQQLLFDAFKPWPAGPWVSVEMPH